MKKAKPMTLREFRKSQKLTQNQMAEKMEIHRLTYVRYENGEIKPHISFMHMLANKFGMEVDHILTLIKI